MNLPLIPTGSWRCPMPTSAVRTGLVKRPSSPPANGTQRRQEVRTKTCPRGPWACFRATLTTTVSREKLWIYWETFTQALFIMTGWQSRWCCLYPSHCTLTAAPLWGDRLERWIRSSSLSTSAHVSPIKTYWNFSPFGLLAFSFHGSCFQSAGSSSVSSLCVFVRRHYKCFVSKTKALFTGRYNRVHWNIASQTPRNWVSHYNVQYVAHVLSNITRNSF